ncbi:MAG: Flp pilus assembly protein CpaB [Sulfuriferula sp.]|nr:Flp pilus assembly protein CpaB [Sulfuriferula sp.]
MNNLTKVIAVVLVIAAIVLAILAWWMGSRPAPVPVAVNKGAVASYPVVVAVHDLLPNKPVVAEDVHLVVLPINPAGAYTAVSAVVGKVPMAIIGAGTPLTEAGMASGLAIKLLEGERAVAIRVDDVIGVSNQVHPGDYVDVFFTLKQGQDVDIDKSQARLLLSRLHVLSYGSDVVGASSAAVVPASHNPMPAPQQPQPQPAHAAVLATPVGDVNQLLLAAQNGKLMLVLRNPTDEKIPDLALFPTPPVVLNAKAGLTKDQKEALVTPDNLAFAGAKLSGLVGDSKARRVTEVGKRGVGGGQTDAKPAPRIEVIRGVKRETETF